MSELSSDDLATRLLRLAPTIDGPASRRLFELRRAEGADGSEPRWWLAAAVVALLVAGVIGLWAMSRDSNGAPLDQPSGETVVPAVRSLTEGGGYETLLVTQTEAEFGSAWLATDVTSYDELMNPGPGVDPIDFDRNVVLIMTRPDNACPDTITRIEIEEGEAGPTWTPVFEDLSSACNDPLLSWLYVVLLDRSALGPRATIRVPAAEPYGVAEQLLDYESERAVPVGVETPEPGGPGVTDTGITVPLPPTDEPTLHSTSVGLVWVVAHGDGSVSVMPGTIPQPSGEDGGVTNLRALVLASRSGRTLTSRDGLLWDDHGRTISGGRVNDLAGFDGRVVDDTVEVLASDATRVDGIPGRPVDGEEYPQPDLPPLIDLTTFATLSSSGPIWRHLDATLVVEDGSGRICDIATDVPVPDLPTCDGASNVLDTRITSSDPDVTTWFHSPILAFQDPLQGFTAIVPLGGRSGRNDAALGAAP